MNHFSYHSEQVHSTFSNGKGQTRRNTVNIKNGKGYKEEAIFSANGKLIHRKKKTLKHKELNSIRNNQFIPGLFKDCKSRKCPSKTRNKRATATRKVK